MSNEKEKRRCPICRNELEDLQEVRKEKTICTCISCGREISKEEYEMYDCMCKECHEIEVADLDFDEE
jgi:Zn finger protein HypA/HybF involved in hydrogenase expression